MPVDQWQSKTTIAFYKVPGRVFLDTCLVNFILDYGNQIHEGAALPPGLSERETADINALYNIFLVGSRCSLEFAISDHTYDEILRTKNLNRKQQLETWFFKIWEHWENAVRTEVQRVNQRTPGEWQFSSPPSTNMDVFPDLSDRKLIGDAITYRCELFCTRDWSTILKYRSKLADLPVMIVNPTELWDRIKREAAG